MSNFKYSVTVAIACAAVVAGGVFAQDTEKAERRQRIRRAAEAAAEAAAPLVERALENATAEGDTFAGTAIVLNEKAKGVLEVTNGGLVVVRIPDSGSRPPADINVEHGGEFQRLGQLRGARMKAGGGWTWVLLKPIAEGESTITVTYTPNGGDPAIKREHNVTVTAAQEAVGDQVKTFRFPR